MSNIHPERILLRVLLWDALDTLYACVDENHAEGRDPMQMAQEAIVRIRKEFDQINGIDPVNPIRERSDIEQRMLFDEYERACRAYISRDDDEEDRWPERREMWEQLKDEAMSRA